MLASQTEADARAAVDVIRSRVREEETRRLEASRRTAEQTPSERPAMYNRSMQDIMGDYLPRIGGMIAPGLGRRAS